MCVVCVCGVCMCVWSVLMCVCVLDKAAVLDSQHSRPATRAFHSYCMNVNASSRKSTPTFCAFRPPLCVMEASSSHGDDM